MSLNCTLCHDAIYSLAAYSDEDPFPISHIMTPFHIYFISQNVWLSLLAFYLYESVWAFSRVFCSEFDLCPERTFICNGHATDNMVSDIHQGFLGVFLAVYFYTVTDMPRWTLSLRDSTAAEILGIWAKRLFFLVLLLASSVNNYIPPIGGVKLGVFFYALSVAIVFVIFYFWNKTRREREVFWTQSESKKFASTAYNILYIGGALISLAILLSWYLPWTSLTYANVLTAWLTVWVVLTVYGTATDRLDAILDLHTLGLYSSCTRRKKTRFRWNKDRLLTVKSKTAKTGKPTGVPQDDPGTALRKRYTNHLLEVS